MRISEILCESPERSRIVSVDNPKDLWSFISEKCPRAYSSQLKLYRGIPVNETPILYGDSTEFLRKSANTQNYYTEMMDNVFSSWSQFPKRSRSFICGTSKEVSQDFGQLYRVFPVGNPIIGFCPTNDLWSSFKAFEGRGGLESFGEKMKRITYLAYHGGHAPKDNLDSIKRLLSKMDELWQIDKRAGDCGYECQNAISELVGGDYRYYFNENNTFSEFLESLFDPTNNRFKLGNLGNVPSNIDGVEAWFSGPSYFVKI